MRSVLGLDSNEGESTHTSFASLIDKGVVAEKHMTLAERLVKTREQNKDLFHPQKSAFLS